MMLTSPVFVFRRLKCVVVRSSRNNFNSSGRMHYERVLLTIGLFCVSTVIILLFISMFLFQLIT